jgi:uncharacterized protein YndB with AHSA1/START domain
VEPVRKTIVVRAPIERAFAVFTEQLGAWWPASHHIGAQPMELAIMEPRAGGRVYERAADGTECDWGRVLAWDPPRRVVWSWHLNAQWQYVADPEQASEIEVRFTAVDAGQTQVQLEHRKFERHGPEGVTIRNAVDSAGGWGALLELYAARANA